LEDDSVSSFSPFLMLFSSVYAVCFTSSSLPASKLESGFPSKPQHLLPQSWASNSNKHLNPHIISVFRFREIIKTSLRNEFYHISFNLVPKTIFHSMY